MSAAAVGGVLVVGLGAETPRALAPVGEGERGILGMRGEFNRKECGSGGRLGGNASPFLLYT